MAFKRRPKKPEEPEDWLLTYADCITLMMAFFVIMANVAKPSAGSFEELRSNFMAEFTEKPQDTPFADVQDAIQTVVRSNQLEQDISIEETPKGLILEFSSESIFRTNSAEILPRARPILDDMALELARFEYDNYIIEVEGHTDDSEINTPLYPSNWELSTARATTVVRYFIEKGIDKTRLKASGFADARPKLPNRDSFDNPIEENRAANRRIRIRLERD